MARFTRPKYEYSTDIRCQRTMGTRAASHVRERTAGRAALRRFAAPRQPDEGLSS
jgi:hypothetical protein